jgi:hypothetical protein
MVEVFKEIGVFKGEHLTFETVMCEADPVAALLPRENQFFSLTGGEHQLIKIPDADGDFVIAFWRTSHQGIFHIAGSIPTSDRRWNRVNRWIQRAPEIMRCYLDEGSFRDLASKMSSLGRPEVRKMTAWQQSDSSSLNRSWPVKVNQERYTPEEVFDQADIEGTSVRTLTVVTDTGLSCHLRRQSGATFYSGRIDSFAEHVLDCLERLSAARLALVSNRQRVADRPLMRPLSISLAEEVFQSAEDTQRLTILLEEQPHLSVAVLHANPYMHLMVSDQADGSTFDVVVTRTDSVEVYPSFRASAPALTRLAQRIGEYFSSARIGEAAPKKSVSLADLLTA